MRGLSRLFSALTERRDPTPRERHRAWWIALVVLIALQVAASVMLVRTEFWVGAGATTTGTVVGHVADSDWKRGTWYREIVEFTAPDGTPTRFIERAPRSDPHPKGALVPVRFRPTEPSDAAIDSGFRIWEGPALLLALGTFGVIVLLLLRGRLPAVSKEAGDRC